jgi:hypothetical protein
MPGPASYQNGFPYNANGEIRILITGGPTPPSGTIPAYPPSNGGLYVSMLPPNVAPVYLKDRVSVEYVPGKGRQFTPYGQLAQLQKIFDDQIAAARNRIVDPVDQIIDRVNAVFQLVLNTHVGNDPHVISSENLLREANHGLQVANSEVQLSEGNVSQKHEAAEKALNDVIPKLGLSGLAPEDYDTFLTQVFQPVSRTYWEEFSVKPRVEEFNAKQRLLAALDNIAVVIQDVVSKTSTLTDAVNKVKKERADAETKAKAEEIRKAEEARKAEAVRKAEEARKALFARAGILDAPTYTPEKVKAGNTALAAVGTIVLNRAGGMVQLSTVANSAMTTASELAGWVSSSVWRGVAEVSRISTVSAIGPTVGAFVVGFWPRKAGEGSDIVPGRNIEMFAAQASLFAAGYSPVQPEMNVVDLPVRGFITMGNNGQQEVILVKTGAGGVSASVPVHRPVRDKETGLDRIVLPAMAGAPSRTILINPVPVRPTAPPHTGNDAPVPVTPVHTGTDIKQADSIVTTSFPASDLPQLRDFIYWQPDATGSGVEAIYVMLSDPLDSGRFTRKQLDKKYLKHARDFGVSDTKKNRETLTEFRDAIDKHLADKGTIEKGTYLLVKDSRVFFNSRTNNVVVISKDNSFVSGWKLEKNTQQYKNYIEKGILR